MRWQPKTFVTLAALAVTSMLLLSFGNHTFNDDRAHPLVLAGFALAFAVATGCLVPLSLHAFVRGQRALGNADLPAVRLVAAHQRAISCAVWLVFAAGLGLGLPFMIREALAVDPRPATP